MVILEVFSFLEGHKMNIRETYRITYIQHMSIHMQQEIKKNVNVAEAMKINSCNPL